METSRKQKRILITGLLSLSNFRALYFHCCLNESYCNLLLFMRNSKFSCDMGQEEKAEVVIEMRDDEHSLPVIAWININPLCCSKQSKTEPIIYNNMGPVNKE